MHAGAGNMMPFGESNFLSGFELPGVVDESGKPVLSAPSPT
jgi:hypothetical protein